jgi:hypothetical protein
MGTFAVGSRYQATTDEDKEVRRISTCCSELLSVQIRDSAVTIRTWSEMHLPIQTPNKDILVTIYHRYKCRIAYSKQQHFNFSDSR